MSAREASGAEPSTEARAAARKWYLWRAVNGGPLHWPDYMTVADEYAAFAEEYSAARVREAVERCCAAVCSDCGRGNEPKELPGVVSGLWHDAGEGTWSKCAASKIRAAFAKEA